MPLSRYLRLTRSASSGQAPPPLQQCAGLTFLVSKETAPPDDLGNLGRDHLVPAFVSGGDVLEDVPRKYRQIFGIIIIKLHEAAATNQIVVEGLQVGGFHLHGLNGL